MLKIRKRRNIYKIVLNETALFRTEDIDIVRHVFDELEAYYTRYGQQGLLEHLNYVLEEI